MTDKKFIPIMGLDGLTEQQKKEYYEQVCEHFGLPANLNLLEYIYMDSGDGARKLVLWAKKGATDIWRDRHNISVKSLVKDEGDGYVMFTATGENEKGRQEMAVGAAETKGKSGKALSDAVMTSQTRAVRRMTLQFVGGGFLDETEVRAESVTTQMTSIPSAAVVAQPAVLPTSASGRDITPKLETSPIKEVAEASAVFVDAFKLTKEQAEAAGLKTGTTVPETGTAPKRQRRKRNTVDFTMPGEESPNADIPESQRTATPSSARVAEVLLSQSLAHPIADIEPAKTPAEIGVMIPQGTPVQIVAGKELPAIQPDIVAGALSAEDRKRFDEKMKHYRNVVLPIPTANNPQSFSTAGGMEPTDGLGGVAIKLRRYAEIMFNTQDLKTLTVVQWERFFSHLDEYLEKFGAVKLVEQIDGTVIRK